MGLFWDNGKENGNPRSLKGVYRSCIGTIGYILGLYWDNGKENGNCRDYIGFIYRGYREYVGVMWDYTQKEWTRKWKLR